MTAWPAFDTLLAALSAAPSRTGSIISTIYGDAILPRGGALALADLLALMRRLGASDGVVRTAVSRLSRDGVLQGRRIGRTSAYALTSRSRTEFQEAVPRIYGPLDRDWDGRLRLAFPSTPDDRAALDQAGFAPIAPSIMLGLDPAPGQVVNVLAEGRPADNRALAAQAWPLTPLNAQYADFLCQFKPLRHERPPSLLDAMATRILLIHAHRRLALRTHRLPAALLPEHWQGQAGRSLCIELYRATAPQAEAWLDAASDGSGPLPRGPDPLLRFTAGDTPPSAPALSPSRSGTPRQAPAAPR